LLDWIYRNEGLLEWLFLTSIISFFVVLILVPVILARLPTDYFLLPKKQYDIRLKSMSVSWLLLFLARNLIGAVFIIIGILMLVLPGQGILTIVVGLAMTEFPGKYQTERWIISRPIVLALVNWVRLKIKKPIFEINTDSDSGNPD